MTATVSWITATGRRTQTHAVAYWSVTRTACGATIGSRERVDGTSLASTDRERATMCYSCWGRTTMK